MDNKTYDYHYLENLQDLFQKTKSRTYELLNANGEDTIADVGCGIGQDVLNIAKSGARVLGIDNDIELIKIANQQNRDNLNVEFILCEATNIPLESNSIDKLKFDRIIQHVENSETLIKEANRLLKKGGILQVIDSDYLSWSFFLEDVNLERKIFDIISFNKFKGTPNIRKLPSLLKEYKFEVTLFEVHNYIVKDFTTANNIVRFDKIINEEFEKGNITPIEFAIWEKHKSLPFNLSINLLIYMATKAL